MKYIAKSRLNIFVIIIALDCQIGPTLFEVAFYLQIENRLIGDERFTADQPHVYWPAIPCQSAAQGL
jgi:hypothetical protein